MDKLQFLTELEAVVADRLRTAPEHSYTAKLAAGGITKVAQKVGEEGVELALAAVAENDRRVTEESADLIFHVLLLLKLRGLSLEHVVEELIVRHNKQ